MLKIMFFHLLLVHTMRLLPGVGPASRSTCIVVGFVISRVSKKDLEVLKEALEVNCSLFFLRHSLPEESAWLGRVSLVNLFDSKNLCLCLGS